MGAVAAHYGLAALSPLERQVVALKAEVPGCVLLAEVGYKYCAFGEDAEVLAAVLHVCSFTKQHMLVAGFPTQRSRPIVLAAALVVAPEVRPLAQGGPSGPKRRRALAAWDAQERRGCGGAPRFHPPHSL